MYKYNKIELKLLKTLRNEYFSNIKFSQELFLEWKIENGLSYEIKRENKIIGYFIKSENDILLEFYLTDESVDEKEKIFQHLLMSHSIKKVYCKSFDSFLLSCSQHFSRFSSVKGILFRDCLPDINLEFDDSIIVKLAACHDKNFLLGQKDDLYETEEELDKLIKNNNIYMFFNANNILLGCGFLIKILEDKNYYDIGMWTNPEYRRRGYASMIIHYLKRLCYLNDFIPVCGCAAENTGSKKTLEKNGFISKHCLIEYEIQSN